MIAHPKPGPDRVYFFAQWLVTCLARILVRLEVRGVENVPAKGPFLIVINHLSSFDPPAAWVTMPHRAVMMGADKWRHIPGLAQFFEILGVIWVARGEADVDAVKAALSVLKGGGVLAMAPEGTRSRTGALQTGKTGAAYLADRAKVPILPIAVNGTETVKRSLKRLRRASVRCVIGKPFYLPDPARTEPGATRRAKGARLDEYTDLIMCHLAALLPTEYRGAYSDHPLLHELLADPP